MNSFDKFNEEQLPSKEHFYSQLYEHDITDKDYIRAKVVWENFNIKNLGEYHDFYLMTVCTYYLMYLKTSGICV